MRLMHSVGVLWLFPTTLGEPYIFTPGFGELSQGTNHTPRRLLDKIAKDIMVCEHKTVKRWDGSIGEYKNYLRKKMVTMGQV